MPVGAVLPVTPVKEASYTDWAMAFPVNFVVIVPSTSELKSRAGSALLIISL